MRSETAVFVGMSGQYAVVNIGESTVKLPCQGWYPPVVGMTVQVEWRAGRGIVAGPAAAIPAVGKITETSGTQATVTINDVPYTLYYRAGYSPTVGDLVSVNWATGVIDGKITGQQAPTPPPSGGGGTSAFSGLVVRAADSGRYQTSWWGNDPWASNNNDGIWVYGSRVRDALKGATVTSAAVYLPLIQQLGNCSIGVHPHPTIPAGAPAIGSLAALPIGGRGGWVPISVAYAVYLAAGGRGIGVTAPGGGYNQWRGVAADGLSGALRFAGTR